MEAEQDVIICMGRERRLQAARVQPGHLMMGWVTYDICQCSLKELVSEEGSNE